MKRYVARFSLLTQIGVLFVVSLSVSTTAAQNQKRGFVKKPWPLEPVSVVSVKTKHQQSIEIGRGYDDDDDWLDGLTVTVVNNYDKTVTTLIVGLVFRREPGDTRLPFSRLLYFGPPPRSRDYLNRDPKKVIKVGQTADLSFSPENYQNLKRALERTGYGPGSVRRVELIIREVGFEDGSMLHTGTLYVQDPAFPDDPTKKIPVVQTKGAADNKPRSPPPRRSSESFSFLKAFLSTPIPRRPDECMAKSTKWIPPLQCSGGGSGCISLS